MALDEPLEGIDPSQALAWWSDYRAGPHDHGFVPGADREVLARRAGFCRMRDEVRWLGLPVFREEVTADVRGNKIELRGENTFARFRGRYRFEHAFDPDGTRVELEATIALKGPLDWLEALARPLVVRVLRWDTRKHLEQMAQAIGPPGRTAASSSGAR